MNESEPILKVRDLTVTRAGADVVRGLDLTLLPGQVVGFLGSNGAGKSSTADAITGFARVRHGNVHFGGTEITHLAPHKVARLGLQYVTQERDLFPGMTVTENLQLGHRLCASGRNFESSVNDIEGVFPKLADLRAQPVRLLSGGEQQMVAIARALIAEPKALILDEPSAGLAPVVVAEIGKFLGDLAESGLPILLIEQNVDVALRLCSDFVVVRAGSRVFAGARDELAGDVRRHLADLYMGESSEREASSDGS